MPDNNLPETTPDNLVSSLTNHKFISVDRIAHLIGVKGLSYSETGRILGIAKQTVAYHCERHGITNKGVAWYRKHKLDLMEQKEGLTLNCMTLESIKKAPARDQAVIFGILYEKGRLEADKSTQNINLQGMLGKLDSKLQALEEEEERLES